MDRTSAVQSNSRPIGDKNYIQKKVPVNKKYNNVSSKLSGKTGMSAKDVNIVSDQLVAKRKDEKYKRIKCSTLAKLLSETQYEESIYNLNDQNSAVGNDAMSYQGGMGQQPQYQEETIGGLLGTGQNSVPNNDTKSVVSTAMSQ